MLIIYLITNLARRYPCTTTMRRILLLICLFTSSLVYSQSTSRVSRVEIKLRKGTEYKTEKVTYPPDMAITFHKSVISVTNRVKSKYTTYGTGVERTTNSYIETEWSAVDEEGIRCKVALIKYNTGMLVVFVTYTDLIVIYEVED